MANYDGTGRELILEGLTSPSTLAYDADGKNSNAKTRDTRDDRDGVSRVKYGTVTGVSRVRKAYISTTIHCETRQGTRSTHKYPRQFTVKLDRGPGALINIHDNSLKLDRGLRESINEHAHEKTSLMVFYLQWCNLLAHL